MLSVSSNCFISCFFLAGWHGVDAAAGGVLDAGDAGRDPHPRVLALHHRRVHRDGPSLYDIRKHVGILTPSPISKNLYQTPFGALKYQIIALATSWIPLPPCHSRSPPQCEHLLWMVPYKICFLGPSPYCRRHIRIPHLPRSHLRLRPARAQRDLCLDAARAPHQLGARRRTRHGHSLLLLL